MISEVQFSFQPTATNCNGTTVVLLQHHGVKPPQDGQMALTPKTMCVVQIAHRPFL